MNTGFLEAGRPLYCSTKSIKPVNKAQSTDINQGKVMSSFHDVPICEEVK